MRPQEKSVLKNLDYIRNSIIETHKYGKTVSKRSWVVCIKS